MDHKERRKLHCMHAKEIILYNRLGTVVDRFSHADACTQVHAWKEMGWNFAVERIYI